MCQQGFDDALQFLHRNNLISCTRCLAVQSTFVVQEAIPEAQEFDPECTECQQHRQVRISSLFLFPISPKPPALFIRVDRLLNIDRYCFRMH